MSVFGSDPAQHIGTSRILLVTAVVLLTMGPGKVWLHVLFAAS